MDQESSTKALWIGFLNCFSYINQRKERGSQLERLTKSSFSNPIGNLGQEAIIAAC